MTDKEGAGIQSETAPLEEIPSDPHLHDDLDYSLIDLDLIPTESRRQQVVVLPKDEDMLRGDMFLVVDTDAVADLTDWI